MDRLGEGAQRVLEEAGIADIGAIARIVEVWPGVVGDEVARQAWPRRLARDGSLHVATTSSTWAFELDRLAPTIVERLRERLGDAAPARLRFAPGLVPEHAPPAQPAPEPVTPTDDDIGEADRMTAEIASPELRELVRKAAALALARRRDDHPI
jgi:hypothetical protein